MTRFLFCGAACVALSLCVYPSSSRAAEPLKLTVPVGGGSLTSPSVLRAERAIKAIPGGADVVPAETFEDGYALSVKDMLNRTPGVLAENRYGEESRLSIRGSGLSRGFHLRGITLLQDGVPFNFADGSGDFQEIDPLIVSHAEVYRGGNGLRYGAASLGGAVNFATKTARTTDYNALLRAEGGSFGTGRLHAEAAKVLYGADVFAAATSAVSDGFRNQSEQNNRRLYSNAGLRLGDRAETRFYVNYNDIEQEVPGTLTKGVALTRPKTTPAINRINDYARDIRSLRLANRTAFVTDGGTTVEVGGYLSEKSLYHPIFQVIDQDSIDVGGFARLSGGTTLGGFDQDFIFGINAGRGTNDAKRYLNIRGNRGAMTADAKQVADNVELYGQNEFHVTDRASLITGLQARTSYRDYTDRINGANSDDKTYHALNPKIGTLYKLDPRSELYASVTRSSEAPTFSELVQGAFPGFVPVAQQKAWTAEAGTRGERNGFNWDVTLYRAHVEDELLNFTVTPDVPASTFNADRTIHQGIEAGAGWQANPWLRFDAIYNLNDFRFDDDEQFGDNDLAGAPRHQVRAFVRAEHKGAYVEPNIEWVPDAPYVDYANTLKADSYTLFGLKAGWDINPAVSVFFEAKNLTDEKTVPTFSTVADARTANTAVFYPNDGRSAFAGLSVKW